MAVQVHVALSAIVNGSAVFAGVSKIPVQYEPLHNNLYFNIL